MEHLVGFSLLSPHAHDPVRGTPEAAGYDLKACWPVMVPPYSRALIPTGVRFFIPKGVYGRIAPRSGLATKYSIDVAAGVCDRDFEGPVSVLLVNNSAAPFEVKSGDRIAQIIFELIVDQECLIKYPFNHTGEPTVRAQGAFGSTGLK